jgi:hypothetical protein
MWIDFEGIDKEGLQVKRRKLSILLVFGMFVVLVTASLIVFAQSSPETIGIFEGHGDVGTVLHAGSAEYDTAQQTYKLSGSGVNMWFKEDAFQFVWKKESGDVALTADIAFPDKGGNEHKKAVLMFRQSLDADSVYADVALHGVGLTALQYREEKGDTTHEVQLTVSAPKRLRLEKHGDYVYLFFANKGEELHPSGAAMKIPLQGTFYVGIGVCAHDKDAIEKATFSNLELKPLSASVGEPQLYSTLETVAVASTDRTAIYVAEGKFEAPNWTRDGAAFLFNSKGRMWRLPITGGNPAMIDTGAENQVNNDHGISPDGTELAISDNSQEADHQSRVYLLPIAGGTPRRMTQNAPSYWHGWSPDGKTLAFVGQRNGDFDIYTIPAAGGEETRLTTAKGLDDGPEYSPDGKYIYFNSERSGHMQIWRMRADGSEQEQVFSDDSNNWFPHISPDGQSMVFLTYDKSVTGHPESKDVMLRLMSLNDKKITVLAKLFGGQGTINVPSWSPDSKNVAFVSYEYLPAQVNQP